MLQHSGLDDAQLGPRLARLLAPGSPLPAREMVARGLAPLGGAEPFLALYHLWVVGGAALAEQASRTAAELPAPAVVSALVDPHLPATVLDFMARRRLRSPDTLRLLVHHPRVSDPTLQTLARAAPTPVCDALAHNQRRWLACPEIAVQLLHNPHCDRATAHAVLELGAREGVAALAELRREVLAGAVLQDSPEHAARLAAWLLRGAASDPLPDLPAPPDALLPASPDAAAAARPDLPERPSAPARAPSLGTPPILGAPPILGVRPPNLSSGPVPKPPPVPTTKQPGKPAASKSGKPAAWPAPRPDLTPEPAPPAPRDLSAGPTAPARNPASPPPARPDLSARPARATGSPPPAHSDLFSPARSTGAPASTRASDTPPPARPDLSSRPAAPRLSDTPPPARPDLSSRPASPRLSDTPPPARPDLSSRPASPRLSDTTPPARPDLSSRPASPRLSDTPPPARPDLSSRPASPRLSDTPPPARPDLSSRPAAPRLSDTPPPARPDLSSRPASPRLSDTPPPVLTDLSRGPAATSTPAANTRPARSLDLTPPAQLDDDLDGDNDELDLPIAEGWDEALGPGIADIPPPAPRSAVPWPETDVPLPPPPPRKPEQRSLFSDALDGVAAPAPLHAPPPAPPTPTYADRVARVFDRRTPLTLAMSLLHQLRPADLRRVAAARHLDTALVIAARRRVRPEARPR